MTPKPTSRRPGRPFSGWRIIVPKRQNVVKMYASQRKRLARLKSVSE